MWQSPFPLFWPTLTLWPATDPECSDHAKPSSVVFAPKMWYSGIIVVMPRRIVHMVDAEGIVPSAPKRHRQREISDTAFEPVCGLLYVSVDIPAGRVKEPSFYSF